MASGEEKPDLDSEEGLTQVLGPLRDGRAHDRPCHRKLPAQRRFQSTTRYR